MPNVILWPLVNKKLMPIRLLFNVKTESFKIWNPVTILVVKCYQVILALVVVGLYEFCRFKNVDITVVNFC